MKTVSVVCAGVLVLLSSLALPISAGAAGQDFGGATTTKDATIVLRSGERLTGVGFKVDQRFQVLQVETAAGARAISIADVASITVGGEDVTESVLGRRGEAPMPRQAVSRRDESFRRDRLSPWKLAVNSNLNFSTPIGDYYEGIDSGVGFEGRLLVAISRTAALRFGFSRSGMQVSDRHPFYAPDPGTILSQDFRLDADRYVFEVQVHRYLSPDSGRLSMLYGYAGLGAVNHAFKLDMRIDDGSGEVISVHGKDSTTKFLTDLGGGVIFTPASHFGIDLSANADVVWLGSNSAYGYGASEYAWIFDLRVGAVWFF